MWYLTTRSLDLGRANLSSLAVAGRWLYVANQNAGAVSVIDLATRVVTTSLSVGEGPVSLGAFIASTPFVEKNGSNTLSRICSGIPGP